jgi:hypothetical protein
MEEVKVIEHVKVLKLERRRRALGKIMKLDDASVITVKGEHSRREGSAYHTDYERMKKTRTVGAYKKAGGDTGILRAAIKEKYVSVA